mmetsp:Transcript_32183/g.85021  ORF Transcript_32183/g.85021 Transcript_32183/m.85021 type:complete len:252 (+) Transcript_32183:65-820(+)
MNKFDGSQEALPPGRSARDLTSAPAEVRRGFVRKVYSLLLCQLLLTTLVAAQIYTAGQSREWLQSHEWLLWVSVGATTATICFMVCCKDVCRRYPSNYVFLFLFTAFEAVMIGFISAMFTWESVLLSAGMTVGVFLCLTLYAFYARTDFTGSAPYLLCAMACLCVFGCGIGILQLVFGVQLRMAVMAYDFLGVLLFSFFIIFDTQLMLGEWGGHGTSFSVDEYVFASLNLYMDIVNMFVHLLSLLGQRRDD